jgi:hypothetical protein
MANKYFNVRQGLQTGNITLDATTGNANVGNLSTTDLNVAGNLNSNLIPNVPTGVPSVISLGTTTQRFKDLYLSGNINLPGSHSLKANTATAYFSGNLTIPSALTANIILANNVTITDTLTSNIITANAINVDAITVNNQITLNSTIDSTSTDTGSITTTGGIGTQGNLTVGGAINLANFASTGSVVKSSIYYDDNVSGINFDFK